ncbi:MAG: DUF5103 domain-containing protein [Alloprevotella sp.]|nr:DUF5103 domain-containing protein [Alloprevotella sp.]
MRGYLFTVCLALWGALAPATQAQRNKMLLPEMRTLTVLAGADGNGLPILHLGSAERLHIGFDMMDTEYRRFTYRIEHLTWDFKPSTELLESDYVRSAADVEVVEDYEESMNTTASYAHYWLEFPNDRMEPLLSGNYRLTIMTEDDEDETVKAAEVYFAVLDPQAALSVSVTTNTDIDWNRSHQQLAMEVDMAGLVLRDERTEVKTIVLQNRRWDNAVVDPAPTHRNGQKLIWSHCRELIFPAGNEFRAFNMLSTRYPGMHMTGMRWEDGAYQAFIGPDEQRRNYLFYEDRNGQYVCRTDDSEEAETESDYCQAHFSLYMDELESHDVYLNGQWTNNRFLPEYRMYYDEAEGCYRADLPLKLGYYSYQYLAVPRDGAGAGEVGPVDGDFWQTENEYTVLVYYRRTGDRYWQLVAETNPSFKPQ